MDERRENLVRVLTLLVVLSIGLSFTTALSLATTYRLVIMVERHEQKAQNTN